MRVVAVRLAVEEAQHPGGTKEARVAAGTMAAVTAALAAVVRGRGKREVCNDEFFH